MSLLRSLLWPSNTSEEPRPREAPGAPPIQGGLLVTEELGKAIKRCTHKVERLAKECKKANRRFRDIEFDLVEDRDRCLHGLDYDPSKPKYTPKDVRRVTDIFEKPEFLKDGATASDICQGSLGDCWFLSALAVVGTVGDSDKLIDGGVCVAKDEKVGIYGFIFWRDSGWVDVIIDDFLFTSVPPWEKLEVSEKLLHHNDKARYQKNARKGGSNLYFAKCKDENETWVPLIEKAYAKLHGDYESLDGGFTSEGVEDLTGGVSTLIFIQDILDTDEFWKNELRLVGKDRLFACFTSDSSVGTEEGFRPTVPTLSSADNGLVVNHAYSVTKAIEFEDPDHEGVTRRFLRVRNPWGKTEWNGRWSDGSGEWNVDWASELKTALDNYRFGNDGEFVMEYEDFLENWGIIERSRLFDDSWHMSGQWLKVPIGDEEHAWSHGDVSYTIDVPEDTDAVIVLAQLDKRYFRELSGRYKWSLDFTLYPMSNDRVSAIGRSIHSALWERSVKLETELKQGKYVVQVRLDRKMIYTKEQYAEKQAKWDDRVLARKHAALLVSQSIAPNFNAKEAPLSLPIPSKVFKGRSVTDLEIKAQEEMVKHWMAMKQKLSDKPSASTTQPPQDEVPPSAITSTAPSDVPPTPNTSSTRREALRALTMSSTSSSNSDRDLASLSAVSSDEPLFHDEPQGVDDGHGDSEVGTPMLGIEGMEPRERTPVPGSFSPERTGPADRSFSGSQEIPRGRPGGPPPIRTATNQAVYHPSAHGSATAFTEDDSPHHHVDFICSRCSTVPRGVMYRCTHITCVEYILCEHCMQRKEHDPDHKFIQSHCKEDDEAIKQCHGQKHGDCWDDLVLGLRVYTKNSVSKVDGQLRTGSILRRNLFSPQVV